MASLATVRKILYEWALLPKKKKRAVFYRRVWFSTRAIRVCPAGLYSIDEQGVFHISEDGCLECGTCLLACGGEVLDWRYPDGSVGVQYRF